MTHISVRRATFLPWGTRRRFHSFEAALPETRSSPRRGCLMFGHRITWAIDSPPSRHASREGAGSLVRSFHASSRRLAQNLDCRPKDSTLSTAYEASSPFTYHHTAMRSDTVCGKRAASRCRISNAKLLPREVRRAPAELPCGLDRLPRMHRFDDGATSRLATMANTAWPSTSAPRSAPTLAKHASRPTRCQAAHTAATAPAA